jgi:hypothetical protein
MTCYLIWIGDFNGDGQADVLFYYPGDDNWWLGTFSGSQLNWGLIGNTAGFGHGINDGRPFWIGRFSRSDRDEVLFYYPGDDNWWLGTLDGGQLSWSPAGNTAGFGHGINDGRPFWIGPFGRSDCSQVLFYFPGDGNWWLGNYEVGQLRWALSGNTGRRWISIGPTRVTSGLGAVGRLSAIAIHPTSPSTLYVGAQGSGVWKTTDGGASWQSITDCLPTLAIAAIAVDPSVPSRVYIATPGFGVFRSEDAGTSWTGISSDLQAEVRWGVLLVHPTNPNVIYLTSALGVYRSGDFGVSWQLSKSGGRATDLVMNPSNPNTLYAAIAGDGIYKTSDGGVGGNSSWTKLSGGLPTTDISQITLALCRNVPGTVYAGYTRSTGLQLYRTTNAGTGVVKLTFPLAQLLPRMPYSPHEHATTNQSV